MLGIAAKMLFKMEEDGRFDKGKIFDVLCYGILSALGIASAVTISEIINYVPQDAQIKISNHFSYKEYVYDDKHLLATVDPGQSLTVKAPYSSLPIDASGPDGGGMGSFRIVRPDAPWYCFDKYLQPDHIDYLRVIAQNPIPLNQMHLAPVGSTSFVTKELV